MAANAENTQGQSGINGASAAQAGLPPNLQLNLPPGMSIGNLDPNQLMALIRMPGVVNMFDKMVGEGGQKDDALANLAQLASFSSANPHPTSSSSQVPIQPYPMHMNEPGPSTHPHGPPGLGQRPSTNQNQRSETEEDSDRAADSPQSKTQGSSGAAGTGATGRSRNANRAAMGSDEWARQRKDNHKEVERRRRGNINEGINELGRIVPNGSGEKAKGAILSRAVQYIHHLKENEARNIEKWTLEKLLMDQAMGDLQHQLEELRRMWEEEKAGRERAERELEKLGASVPNVKDESKRRASSVDGTDESERSGGKRLRAD